MNESLFYPDGYKLTVTDQDDNLLSAQLHTDTKNYIGLELSDMDSLTDGETIKVNLTPTNVSGTSEGTESANGYTIDWTVQDMGSDPSCTFQVDFGPSPTGEDNFADYLVYLYDSQGNQVAKVTNDRTINTSCYQMSGGTV